MDKVTVTTSGPIEAKLAFIGILCLVTCCIALFSGMVLSEEPQTRKIGNIIKFIGAGLFVIAFTLFVTAIVVW
jgi:hypothetical protein